MEQDNTNNHQTALPTGMRLQHFEILDVLGRGGFGITYLALDKQRNRPVVIKEFFPKTAAVRRSQQTQVRLLSHDSHKDFDAGLKRFEQEALTLSDFKHPNIVEVIAMFPAHGTAYFVMEHIEGQSLEDALEQRGRAFTESELHKELLPILNGLAELHAKKLLHLDIKADNILTSKYGEPLLIDFGGARYFTGQVSKDISFMVATEGYAPPEQYSMKQVQTPATDLYAFGMTLYHLMAPKAELPGSRDRQDALFNGTPDPLIPIRELVSGYSEAIYQVIEVCTQVRPADRPQTVAEVQALLPEQQDVPIVDIDRTPSPAPEPATIPTPEPEKSQSESAPQPTPAPIPAPINSGHSEPEKKKSPLLAIVAAVVLLVGGVLGYQQYQIQQEELKQAEIQRKELERQAELARQEAERRAKAEAERKEQERLAKLEAERKAKEAAARKAEQERQARAERERKFREGYTVTAGGVSFRMRGIPSGSFMMGSNNGDGDEKPVHRVSISSFYMMETEVTWSLYQQCIDAGSCPDNSGDGGDNGWGKGNRPVIEVSWNDITKKFIPWLNRKTGKTFRLPSESEWEYAARAGSTTKYSWGDSIDCSKARYGYLSDECGKQKSTDPVKSFSPNAFGLYDMHGNVWEWVQDCWNDHYNNGPYNNRARESGDCAKRVLRGGSWYSNPTILRSAYRHGNDTSYRNYSGGFRLVQAP